MCFKGKTKGKRKRKKALHLGHAFKLSTDIGPHHPVVCLLLFFFSTIQLLLLDWQQLKAEIAEAWRSTFNWKKRKGKGKKNLLKIFNGGDYSIDFPWWFIFYSNKWCHCVFILVGTFILMKPTIERWPPPTQIITVDLINK